MTTVACPFAHTDSPHDSLASPLKGDLVRFDKDACSTPASALHSSVLCPPHLKSRRHLKKIHQSRAPSGSCGRCRQRKAPSGSCGRCRQRKGRSVRPALSVQNAARAELRGRLLHVPLQFGIAVIADVPANVAICRTEPLHLVSKQPSVVIVGPI